MSKKILEIFNFYIIMLGIVWNIIIAFCDPGGWSISFGILSLLFLIWTTTGIQLPSCPSNDDLI